MNDDVAIKVEHVSKKYCKTLKHSMLYGMSDIGRNLIGLGSNPDRLRSNEFWAVDDVSFELRKGEALGLIGPNGSGKSTLLKMLNGIFWPDKGKITVKGRVGALIEVGAGFHQLLTGRENVYVNGAILGMTKEEVEAKFDDIVEFAEIGDFIDSPVKTYSSGMYVKLGFAVAAHCEPDILLIDEVLSVGDINFQLKCLRRVRKMMDNTAVILVSHYPYIIRFNCQQVLFLNEGKTQYLGQCSDGVDAYVDYMMKQNLRENVVKEAKTEYDSLVELTSLQVFNKNFQKIDEIVAGDTVAIECSFNAIKPIEQAIIGISFYLNNVERSFSCFSSQVNGGQFFNLSKGQHKFRIIIPQLNLQSGIYGVGVRISADHELSVHAETNTTLLVKNSRPEFGSYNMQIQFEMDKERNPLVF